MKKNTNRTLLLPAFLLPLLAGAQGVGINQSTPARMLEVLDAAAPQLRLTYTNTTVYTDFQVTAAGELYINPTGSNVGVGTNDPNAVLHLHRTTSGQSLELSCTNDDIDFRIGETGTGYGFYWKYVGTQTGNDNELELWSENTTGADIQIYEIEQDGEINFVQNVGFGTNSPGAKIHAQTNTTSNPSGNYGILIENTNTEAEIRLRPGGANTDYTLSADDGANKFRLFAEGTAVFQILEDDDLQAVIRDDASAQNDDGWATAIVDYAEFMEKLDPEENIRIFEVIGVKNGRITKNTDDATFIMVTATDAGLRGGNPMGEPGEEDKSRDNDPDWLAVAFIGQMPVLVGGEVREGDYIIPSGNHDGTAVAVARDKITLEQYEKLIGVALESSAAPVYEQQEYDCGHSDSELDRELCRLQQRKGNMHIINVAVNVNMGLPQSLKNEITELRSRIGHLETALYRLIGEQSVIRAEQGK